MDIAFDLVRANREWLANEASHREVFYHRASEDAAWAWRQFANERLAARQRANSPWPVKTANAA